MELYFLGTGAGLPSKRRNVTSIALRLQEERGTFWLFDCGEGTQHQILRSPLKLSKLEFIFITHLHGDHVYGLPGLLSTRSYQGGETPLTVFGPPGIKRMMDTVFELSQANPIYELTIQEIDEGVVFADDRFEVRAAKVEHRVESYGYRIMEREKPGRLDERKLRELGVPPGPLYGVLKQGGEVRLPDGRLLRGTDFVGTPIRGRTIAIIGDTRRCEAAAALAREADVLVHEATFAGGLEELADEYGHTTATGAAETAREANAETLIITHISSRYQEEDAVKLLEEARQVFPNTYMAHDFWSFSVPNRR